MAMTNTCYLRKLHSMYSPFGPCTISAPSHYPPLWRTKGLLGPWWGSSQSHEVRSSRYIISVTAVIRGLCRVGSPEWLLKLTQPLGMEMFLLSLKYEEMPTNKQNRCVGLNQPFPLNIYYLVVISTLISIIISWYYLLTQNAQDSLMFINMGWHDYKAAIYKCLSKR